MSVAGTAFFQDVAFITAAYIVAFGCFIYGLHLLNHPRRARRGNIVAAAGMALAVVATLLYDFVGDYLLIAVGVAIVFGTINVVGGFLVTDRMLGMFKGRQPPRGDAKATEKAS